jgi:hypothetical protein
MKGVITMRQAWIGVLAVGLVGALAAAPASAGRHGGHHSSHASSSFRFSIGFGGSDFGWSGSRAVFSYSSGRYYGYDHYRPVYAPVVYPPAVYYTRQLYVSPVYVSPAPVYVAPAPVYSYRPVYCAPPVYHITPRYSPSVHRYHYEHRGGRHYSYHHR